MAPTTRRAAPSSGARCRSSRSRDARPELLRHRLAHLGQRRAVDVIGPYNQRDALVRRGDPVVLLPVRTAPPGRGAEDVAPGEAKFLRVGIAGVGELRLTLEDQEPGPPVDVRDQDRAPG